MINTLRKQRTFKVGSAGLDFSLETHNIPWVRIQGKWLDRAGFKFGSKVEIVEGDNELVLRVIKNE